jgi:OTU-like cysteine protease
MRADGNCQFRAVSHGLYADNGHRHVEVRAAAAEFLRPRSDLAPFLVREEFPTWEAFVDHAARDGAFGDHLTLYGCAGAFKVDVAVLRGDGSAPQIVSADSDVGAVDAGILPRRRIQVMYYADREHYDGVDA